MKENMESFREWILSGCLKPGFADAHIDRFVPAFRERSRWIEGAVIILDNARKIREEVGCGDKLALVFTLKSDLRSRSSGLQTREDFENQLDHSPPSIFIAKIGSEPWVTSRSSENVRIEVISTQMTSKLLPALYYCEGLLMEYRPYKNEEPSRTAWFIS